MRLSPSNSIASMIILILVLTHTFHHQVLKLKSKKKLQSSIHHDRTMIRSSNKRLYNIVRKVENSKSGRKARADHVSCMIQIN